ncbi:haloacid dehalogenase-like hydrolase [Aspergillus karnatakaensis]|uniref:HAD family hydrolase n=1 Tax=Aspergillus karnatakaensis TaxID=1810916 RepID=UPI003CCDAD30
MFKLVIFDFDGTLFDSFEAIATSVRLTFEALTPDVAAAADELYRLIAVGAPPEITFKALQPNGAATENFDETVWVNKYRELYAVHGQPLTKPYTGAKEVLIALHERNIPIAIISNKSVAAVKTALEKTGLNGLVPDSLIIGEPMFEGKRKPDPAGYTDILLPRLKEEYGEEILSREGEVLMVGDTITDILFARNIGSPVCWCRFGQGNKEECEKLKPEFTINALSEFEKVIASQ